MSEDKHTMGGYLGNEYQLKLMWQLVTAHEFAEEAIPYLSADYFEDITFKRYFLVLKAYFSENGKSANLQNKSLYHAITKHHKDEIDKETLLGITERIKNWNDRVLNKDLEFDGDIVQKEALFFIQQQEYYKLAQFIEYQIKNGEVNTAKFNDIISEKFRKIVSIGQQDNDGSDVFNEINKALQENHRETTPTGIHELDYIMGGGLARGEVGIILAGTGIGKSTILTKIANNAVECDRNVLHIYFEDNKVDIQRKHFALWSDVRLSELTERREYVEQRVLEAKNRLTGNLVIKSFSEEGTTMLDIRNYIERYHKKYGVKFDVIVLDYIDCVDSHKRGHDQYQDELNIFKSFQSIAKDFNAVCWSAIQANRAGNTTEEMDISHTGGTLKRIQKANFIMGITKTTAQKEANTANIKIMKARFAKDGQYYKDCIFNNDTMEIRITPDFNTSRRTNIESFQNGLLRQVNEGTIKDLNQIAKALEENSKAFSEKTEKNNIVTKEEDIYELDEDTLKSLEEEESNIEPEEPTEVVDFDEVDESILLDEDDLSDDLKDNYDKYLDDIRSQQNINKKKDENN